MLLPLYDRECNHIGWLLPERYIFDENMEWMAYLSHGHVWSSSSGNWMGPVNGAVCLDRDGKVIAWGPDSRISGMPKPARPARAARVARPARPARPSRPARPARPATPSSGWSDLSICEWINQ